MSNDSMRKSKSTPAPQGAHPLLGGDYSTENSLESGELLPVPCGVGAHALLAERLTIDRISGTESICLDNERFHRDTDLAKALRYERPRNVRKLIVKMIQEGQITDDQYIVIDDDDGGRIFYLSKNAAIALTVRSKSVTAEMMMSMMTVISAHPSRQMPSISDEKAASGYRSTIAFLSKKDTPRAGKLAMVPVLEKYARAAGLPMPDVSELIGPDQPRLAGV